MWFKKHRAIKQKFEKEVDDVVRKHGYRYGYITTEANSVTVNLKVYEDRYAKIIVDETTARIWFDSFYVLDIEDLGKLQELMKDMLKLLQEDE